jgi:hypothetical protein
MMRSQLLTVDEARHTVVLSAWRCLEGARCPKAGVHSMLWGLCGGPGWSRRDRILALEHRRVLEVVAGAGYGWIVPEELEGIEAAALAEAGQVVRLDAIAEVLGLADDDGGPAGT